MRSQREQVVLTSFGKEDLVPLVAAHLIEGVETNPSRRLFALAPCTRLCPSHRPSWHLARQARHGRALCLTCPPFSSRTMGAKIHTTRMRGSMQQGGQRTKMGRVCESAGETRKGRVQAGRAFGMRAGCRRVKGENCPRCQERMERKREGYSWMACSSSTQRLRVASSSQTKMFVEAD